MSSLMNSRMSRGKNVPHTKQLQTMRVLLPSDQVWYREIHTRERINDVEEPQVNLEKD